jgi:hypothetical protein
MNKEFINNEWIKTITQVKGDFLKKIIGLFLMIASFSSLASEFVCQAIYYVPSDLRNSGDWPAIGHVFSNSTGASTFSLRFIEKVRGREVIARGVIGMEGYLRMSVDEVDTGTFSNIRNLSPEKVYFSPYEEHQAENKTTILKVEDGDKIILSCTKLVDRLRSFERSCSGAQIYLGLLLS